MKNKFVKFTSVVLAMVLSLSLIVYAENEDTITMAKDANKSSDSDVIPKAELELVSTEKDGFITLEFKVKNTVFVGTQVAIRYDKSIIAPVNESGEITSEFKEFAQKTESATCFDTVGLVLDSEKGLYGFTLYIMPGTEADNINSSGEYVADSDGICLYRFRFKRISVGDYSFEIATKSDEKPYQPAVPEGIIISSYKTKYEANISFVYDVKDMVKVSIKPIINTLRQPSEFTSEIRKEDAIFMVIGESASFVNGKKTLIDSANKQVVPYIKNDRTLVPLRFVSESIGAEVLWEDGWDYCLIKKDGKEIKITFGSAEFEVNGEKFTYEAPIETVHDRTMVPVRFISEHLGYNVYWQELNQAVVITPESNPWVENRNAEKTALIEVIVSIKGILP